MAIDANQRWDVDEAIDWVRGLAPYGLRWIEEPTSPDDVLGMATIARAVAPIAVATGEHVANRIIFKQLLQAEAISVLQIDACRVGGVNENLAILLLAAKFGVPVCPHAGGVGLCELVQHLAMADFVAVSGEMDGRVIEFVDHLHEHFVDPVAVVGGRYVAPTTPGSAPACTPQRRSGSSSPTVRSGLRDAPGGDFDGPRRGRHRRIVRHRSRDCAAARRPRSQVDLLDIAAPADRLTAGHPRPSVLACDVTDDVSVARRRADRRKPHGRLDIVVANAGIGAQGTVEENTDDEWHRVLDVNVVGVARTVRAALPSLRSRQRRRSS